MTKPELNYQDYTYDPQKSVLVPFPLYERLVNFLKVTEQEHVKVFFETKTSFYNKVTNEPLSAKASKTITEEEKEKRYYENINLEKTKEASKVFRDEIALEADYLIGNVVGIFRYNVEQGNCILKNPPLESEDNETSNELIISDMEVKEEVEVKPQDKDERND